MKILVLTLATLALFTTRGASASPDACWQLPRITSGNLSPEEVAQAEHARERILKAIAQPGMSPIIANDTAYIGPKLAALTWRIEITKAKDEYWATVDCIGTETTLLYARTVLRGRQIDSLGRQIVDAILNTPGPPPLTEFADANGKWTRLSVRLSGLASDFHVKETERAEIQILLADVLSILVADKSISVQATGELELLLEAQDLSASGRFPYRIQTGRMMPAAYTVAPTLKTNAKSETELILRICDAEMGTIRTRRSYPIATLPSAKQLAEEIKAMCKEGVE